MTTLTQGARAVEFILNEFDTNYCHATGTLVSGQNLVAGTVVMDNGSGKLTAYLAGSPTDGGTAEAAGILLYDGDASGGDITVTYLARGPATVKGDLITYPAGTDEEANTIESLGFLNPPIIVIWGTRTE